MLIFLFIIKSISKFKRTDLALGEISSTKGFKYFISLEIFKSSFTNKKRLVVI